MNLNSNIYLSQILILFCLTKCPKKLNIYNRDQWGLDLNSDQNKYKEYQKQESGMTMVIKTVTNIGS